MKKVLPAVLALALLGLGAPGHAGHAPGALLGRSDFSRGTDGWTAEGSGGTVTVGGHESGFGPTFPSPPPPSPPQTDSSELALRVSATDASFRARSPVLPAGTEHIVAHIKARKGSEYITLLEARNANDQVVFAISAKNVVYVEGETKVASTFDWREDFWYRFDVVLVNGGYAVSLNGGQTLTVAGAASGPVASLVARPGANSAVALNDVRYHAAGAIREDIFNSGGPVAAFETFSSGTGGEVSYSLPNYNGFREAGYAAVEASHRAGAKKFVAWDATGLGNRIAVGTGFRLTNVLGGPEHMAVLAGLTGTSGDGDVLWAVTLASVATGVYSFYLYVDGAGLSPLPGVVLYTTWSSVHAIADLTAGTLELSWSRGSLGTVSNIPLAQTKRFAFGDVFGDVFAGDEHVPALAGSGNMRFDDAIAVPAA